MIQLLFGCYCSELKVHPQNWQKPKASMTKDWYIYYRFYDPLFKLHSEHLREQDYVRELLKRKI